MRLVVLGDPVAHSLSPAIHTAALSAAGLPGTYEARRVDAAALTAAVDEVRDGRLDGANVTMPHKQLAASLCDHLAATAHRAGAVNTLVRVGSDVVGHNTDVAGIVHAWRWADLPDSAPVLVLGAGGAAAAALLALEGRQLTVTARTAARATALVAATEVDATVEEWPSQGAGRVVVNATPIGMRSESLPSAVLDGALGLFDMAYGSGLTPAAATGRSVGIPVSEGPDMLLAQAAESFRLWTGVFPDLEAMRAALVAGLAGSG